MQNLVICLERKHFNVFGVPDVKADRLCRYLVLTQLKHHHLSNTENKHRMHRDEKIYNTFIDLTEALFTKWLTVHLGYVFLIIRPLCAHSLSNLPHTLLLSYTIQDGRLQKMKESIFNPLNKLNKTISEKLFYTHSTPLIVADQKNVRAHTNLDG